MHTFILNTQNVKSSAFYMNSIKTFYIIFILNIICEVYFFIIYLFYIKTHTFMMETQQKTNDVEFIIIFVIIKAT